MKTKNASGLVVGIVITVFVLILVGGIIVWGSGYFNQNKKTLGKTTSKIDTTMGEMTDFDFTAYDGASIRGDELVDLIADYKKKNAAVSIGVKTLAAMAASPATVANYNYAYTDSDLGAEVTLTPPASKSASDYINPNDSFLGEVIRNDNDEIVYILFTQQK